MIVQFWLGAALLSVAALGFVLVPLWRQRQMTGSWSRLGSAAAALLVPAAVALYLGIGAWDGRSAPEGGALPPMAQLVEGLAERLREQPDDPAGWYLLGQSYMSLNRPADARLALREALAREPAPGVELKLALAEAEILTDPQSLLGEAGRIFEETLAAEPDNPTALWYGGLAAAATRRPEVARRRWSRLLQLDPPQVLRDALQQHLDALGGIVGPVVGATAAVETAEAAEPVEAAGSAGTLPRLAQIEPPGGPEIRLRIRLGDGIDAGAVGTPAAALFVFARAPEGGPPVAVIRTAATAVPGDFSLSDANGMLPGRSLADFDALTIVARISASGQPAEQPGDLYGELLYRVADGDGPLELIIDRVAR